MLKFSGINYFPYFKWAIPLAFSKALNQCYFEVGDILYNKTAAYGPWNNNNPGFEFHIQIKEVFSYNFFSKTILYPAGFYKNWNRKVLIELKDYKANHSEEIMTTQGRLYSFLIKDDIQILKNDTVNVKIPKFISKNLGVSKPPLTFELNDFQKKRINQHYKKVKASNRNRIKKYFNTDFDAKENTLFITTCDLSDIKQKIDLKNLYDQLKSKNPVYDKYYEPQIVGLNDLYYSPTNVIVRFLICSADKATINEILKKVFYKQNLYMNAVNNRFNINSHGMLI